MKELTSDEIRDIQLELLRDFNDFCKAYNLRYFLDAGTLLGAVRHKGFIPWDNDVDVGMPRVDYDKFMKIASRGYKNSELIYPENSIYTYLKIKDKRTVLFENTGRFENEIGVYIDVFPKDGIKKINFFSKLQCYVVSKLSVGHWFLKTTRYRWRKEENKFKKLIAIMSMVIKDDNFFLRILLKISKRRKFDESDYVATIEAGGLKNVVPRECLSRYKKAKFENLDVNIPVGYDIYLRQLYGEYMKLPPEEQRVANHNYRAYIEK